MKQKITEETGEEEDRVKPYTNTVPHNLPRALKCMTAGKWRLEQTGG